VGEELNASPHEGKTIEQAFNEICPYLIAMGCSYDDFWYNDTDIAKQYLKAHEIKRRQENERLWLQGYYFYVALCDVAPVLNAFAKKGTKVQPYPNEPFALTMEEIAERREQEEQERQNRLQNLKEKLKEMSKKGE